MSEDPPYRVHTIVLLEAVVRLLEAVRARRPELAAMPDHGSAVMIDVGTRLVTVKQHISVEKDLVVEVLSADIYDPTTLGASLLVPQVDPTAPRH